MSSSFIKTYKSTIASRYVPVDVEQIGSKIMESAYYLTSVKYDGHLTFLSVENGIIALYNSSGQTLHIPSILEEAKSIKEDVILAGELCCFTNGESTTHREVSVAIANPEKYDLRLAVFDIISLNGKDVVSEPKEKTGMLVAYCTSSLIFPVDHKVFESRKDVISFFKEVSPTTEGVVVRIPNGITYKIKKSITLDLVVLGYAEASGERTGMLRELLLGFALGGNRYQIVTKCGGGFSDNERHEILKKLEKEIVISDYTEVSGAKTAFVMIKPAMVVEISCLDLINETTAGAIQKFTLLFDVNAGYKVEQLEPTLSIISPNFIRFREDKMANEVDAGTKQAYQLMQQKENPHHHLHVKPSEIIHKEVYCKDGKEGRSVRKFIGLKTHKESTGMFSPYVLIYTDYSFGRKSPLDQELYLCQTSEELMTKMAFLKEDNIKKGWEFYK